MLLPPGCIFRGRPHTVCQYDRKTAVNYQCCRLFRNSTAGRTRISGARAPGTLDIQS